MNEENAWAIAAIWICTAVVAILAPLPIAGLMICCAVMGTLFVVMAQ